MKSKHELSTKSTGQILENKSKLVLSKTLRGKKKKSYKKEVRLGGHNNSKEIKSNKKTKGKKMT